LAELFPQDTTSIVNLVSFSEYSEGEQDLANDARSDLNLHHP